MKLDALCDEAAKKLREDRKSLLFAACYAATSEVLQLWADTIAVSEVRLEVLAEARRCFTYLVMQSGFTEEKAGLAAYLAAVSNLRPVATPVQHKGSVFALQALAEAFKIGV